MSGKEKQVTGQDILNIELNPLYGGEENVTNWKNAN